MSCRAKTRRRPKTSVPSVWLEILEPLAKWGALLVGAGALVFFSLRGIRNSAENKLKAELSDARVKAFEEEGKRRGKRRETRRARRARLKRFVRDAKD